ncbi:MAG: fibrillarin-like rRNA/tRNA 2'-O-methyltransferase [Thermoplasmata archaeon]|nr:fibrillarin-like rRNA/tRNA 2'-O-methyltransferase [Thermoplasmata archaeon]
MEREPLRRHRLSGLFTDGKRLLTRNLTPGKRVYGEELVVSGDEEYRVWNPRRSKMAALVLKGLETFPFESKSNVLYLGAATGTTSSHISDIVNEGLVYCVEFSPRAFRKLLNICGERANMMPILADASAPDKYSGQIGPVDVLYQDIAQRDQVPIFQKNLRFLRSGSVGYLMVKARSIDVAAKPRSIYSKVGKEIKAGGLDILEQVELDPYEKDHAAFVVRMSKGRSRHSSNLNI